MVSKTWVGIILVFNIFMGFFIFHTGTQNISTLAASYPQPQDKYIVTSFNFWSIGILPYYYVYGTPFPYGGYVPIGYTPTYGFIFMLIVNSLFGLILLRSKKEEGTKISS